MATGDTPRVMSARDMDQDSTAAAHRSVSPAEVLAGAAHSLILGRCRHIYIHELRAALHPSLFAVELLSRAANSAARNPSLIEQSSTQAKRAMGFLDKSTVELFNQMIIVSDPARTVNVGTMLEEIVRLLRTDIDIKSIVLQFTNTPDVVVRAPAWKMRLYLLGLVAMTIDQLSEAAEFSVALMRGESNAVIEMHAGMEFPQIDTPERLLGSCAGGSTTPYGLVVAAARQWFQAGGGGLEFLPEPAGIRLLFPLRVAQQAEITPA